jgi:hypothetical protein
MTSKGGEASALFTDIDAEVPVGSPDMEKLKKVIERNGVRLAGG